MDFKKFDDPTLMRLIAQSQEDALGELYDRYSRLVYSMALNVIGEPALAEEITQEVFIRIWDHAEVYQPARAKVSTWVVSMTRHRAIDVLRSLKVRPEGHKIAWDIADIDPENPESNPIDVEQEAEINLKRRRVRQAIASLPDAQREALAYAYFQGYSHRQIAEILNEPLGTVKTRIRLAMQKLRQILEQENYPDR